MEQYSNTATYNVESVLQKNIVGSEYYNKTCLKLENWTQVVDEIWSTVADVEPWMSGNARGASTAFCLLFRLFNLKITEEEVKALLDHTDSPYIRAVGFLYLRYVGNPKSLWQWLAPYVRDSEEFTPSPEGFGKTVTMGAFVRDIFLEQAFQGIVRLGDYKSKCYLKNGEHYYFETIFPRIPKPVQNDFVSKLTAMGLPSRSVGNGGQGGADRRGVEEGNRRPASVKASLSVAFGQRAPNRATAREEGRGLGAGMKGGSGQSRVDERDRDRDRDRDRERDRKRDRERERERRERDRDRDRDRYHKGHRDQRHRSERDWSDRDRSRQHDSRHERDRHAGRDAEQRHGTSGRDRENGRHRDR